MNWILVVVFLLTDLMMVGIMAGVFKGKGKYQEGMILGVHIPKEEVESQEIEAFVRQYKSHFHKVNTLHFVLGILICSVFYFSSGWGMILWTLWFCWYMVHIYYFVIMKEHRKLYDIKMQHGWIREGSAHVVKVDLQVSAASDSMPVSHWWNGIFVVMIVACFFLPGSREFFGTYPVMSVFPGVMLLSAVIYWILHRAYCYRKNVYYSQDTELNLRINRSEKRIWSVIFLITNALGTAGMLWIYLRIQLEQWIGAMDFWIFLIVELSTTGVILAGVYEVKKLHGTIPNGAIDQQVDDDEYWKNGWYNNPDDKRTFVPDRLQSSNYSMNMAKKGARITVWLSSVLFIILMVGVGILLMQFEHIQVTVKEDGTTFTVAASIYDISFSESDIKKVTLETDIPDDRYVKTNGGATDEYYVGYFRGRETGKCMMFLYRNFTPVIKIQLENRTLYVNSKDASQTRQWYQMLTQ